MLNSKHLTLMAASLSVAATLGIDIAGLAVITAFVAAMLAICE